MLELTGLSYLGIFLSLILAGTLIPFPEEVILLSVGYAASAHLLHPVAALSIAIISIVIGDNILFALARHGGDFVDRLYARLTASRAGKFAARGDNYPGPFVFVTRFIIGVRTLSPFIAVNQGMHWWRFFLWDTAAVVVYTPLWFYVGFHFHHTILRVIRDIALAKHLIFIVCTVLVAVLIVRYAYGAPKAKP